MRVSNKGLNQLGPPRRVAGHTYRFYRGPYKKHYRKFIIERYQAFLAKEGIVPQKRDDRNVMIRTMQGRSLFNRKRKVSLPVITMKELSDD